MNRAFTLNKKSYFFLALWFITLCLGHTSCQDDDEFQCSPEHMGQFQSQLNEASADEKYQVLTTFFSSIEEDSAYINNIDSSFNNAFVISADNGDRLCIPRHLIKDISTSNLDFRSTITLNNQLIKSVPSVNRSMTLEADSLKVNPYDVNPLSALRSFRLPIKLKTSVQILGKHGALTDIDHDFSNLSTSHTIPILGLYPDYENIVIMKLSSHHGSVFYTDTLKITTSTLSVDLPSINILNQNIGKMKSGVNLVSSKNHSIYEVPFCFDAFGDIRWLLDYKDHPTLNRLSYDTGLKRLKNGNWYFGDIRLDRIFEIGPLGNILNQWHLGEFSFHHDVIEKEDGNFIVTVSKSGSIHLNGRQTKEDYIIEIDRATNEVLQVWDLKESLDEYRTSIADNLNNSRVDWLHANSVYHDVSDNTIVVSSRYQGVIKLTNENQVKWIISPHRGWTKNRSGQDLNPFLLTPLDRHGQQITNLNILQGEENHADFEWVWGQHSVSKTAEQTWIMYDNGHHRNFDDAIKYSRAVEYKIDENHQTIQQVWTFGKQLGSEYFSPIASNSEYFDKNENVFMNAGFLLIHGGQFSGNCLEIDKETKEIYFEAEFTVDDPFAFHRVNRITLYK